MTKAQKTRLDRFLLYATFGCLENPSTTTIQARNLANNLGLNGVQMIDELADKIEIGLKGKNWKTSQPDTIRFDFVRKWILERL